MQIETIERNNKKVLKKTKKDGTITYSMKGAYLGTDKKNRKASYNNHNSSYSKGTRS